MTLHKWNVSADDNFVAFLDLSLVSWLVLLLLPSKQQASFLRPILCYINSRSSLKKRFDDFQPYFQPHQEYVWKTPAVVADVLDVSWTQPGSDAKICCSSSHRGIICRGHVMQLDRDRVENWRSYPLIRTHQDMCRSRVLSMELLTFSPSLFFSHSFLHTSLSGWRRLNVKEC